MEHHRSSRKAGLAGVLVSSCFVGVLGCGSALQVKKLDGAAQPSGSVAVYFTVDNKEGQPVPDLTPANFKVYEDGKLVSEKKAKRALLDPRVALAMSTLVLVDISGPIADSEELPTLVTAVARLVERVSRLQDVAVSAFDGAADLIPILPFDAADVRGGLEHLRTTRPRLRAGNLNGAIVEGLRVLEARRESAQVPHAFSNLVVFTDRGDLAHKVSGKEVQRAISRSGDNVRIIAVGDRVNEDQLSPLASGDGLFLSTQTKDLNRGFLETSKQLDAAGASHYVLSYCSTKHKGQHTLEVEVIADGGKGRIKQKFQADDFQSDECAPRKRPVFGDRVASRGKHGKEN